MQTFQPAADQYGAAAMLYRLLTNSHIRDLSGGLAARIEQIVNHDPVPILQRQPSIPEGLATVIHRALEPEPDRRDPDIRHFRRALRPFAE